MKHKKEKSKCADDSSDDESSVSPKKKRKVKKLRKGPKIQKQAQKKESKFPEKKHVDCMIPVPVIVLYLCRTLVSTLNSTEFHLQGVAPRSKYSDPAPEAVTLQ